MQRGNWLMFFRRKDVADVEGILRVQHGRLVFIPLPTGPAPVGARFGN
jgi:hypothetical protein